MEVARAHSFMPGSGIPLRMPVIDMIEIGAGGGSIASLDQLRRIAVGPESAGSNPGPACYGLGGILPTVTDADLILGKLDPDEFAGGTMKLDEAGARAAMERDLGAPLGLQVQEAAAGLAEIVDENMANATRVNAADHGDQVETRVLIATGGAAPLHAARIAEKLSIDKIVIPADAGVGSAYGFLMAPVAYEAVRSQVLFMDDFKGATVNSIFADLRREAAEVLELASTSSDFKERRYVEMRYLGQGHDLTVEIPSQNYGDGDHALLEQLFHQTYEKNFNRTIPNLGAQALTWTLVLFLDEPEDALQAGKERPSGTQAKPEGAREIFDTGLGRTVKADVISRQSLSPGTEFSGPAIITEEQTTTYLPPAFSGWINANHHLIMERREEE
jgi:N-methylhydantoinase A